MQRRHLAIIVAFVALGVLAGCSSAGSIDFQAVNDTELADRASRSTDPPTHEPEIPVRPPWEIATAAIENGSTTVTARAPPLEPGLPFEHEGSYYNISYDILDNTTQTAVSMEIDYNASNTSGDAIAYTDLPARDRDLIEALFPGRRPAETGNGTDFGVSITYSDAELNRSVLAPVLEYHIIIYEGERYRLHLEDTEPVDVHTYDYQSRKLANDTHAYAELLRDKYTFTLSSLPTAQQSIVEEAIDDGSYIAESTDDEAFDALVDRFLAHDAITRSVGTGEWLVRYDGTIYYVDLRYGQFIEEDTTR